MLQQLILHSLNKETKEEPPRKTKEEEPLQTKELQRKTKEEPPPETKEPPRKTEGKPQRKPKKNHQLKHKKKHHVNPRNHQLKQKKKVKEVFKKKENKKKEKENLLLLSAYGVYGGFIAAGGGAIDATYGGIGSEPGGAMTPSKSPTKTSPNYVSSLGLKLYHDINNELSPCAAFKFCRKLPGHFGKIYALHWASNNEDIVSASQDGKLLIWNISTTNKKIAIPLRSVWVMTCAYSPSLKYVASGGLDNLCTIFDVKDSIGWDVNQPHRELQRHEGYLSCCRLKDNNSIITLSGDKQSALQSFVDHNGHVESVSIAPNNNNIFFSGSIDAMAKVWDIRQGNNAIANFKGPESDINSVEWFPDGNAFISGSDDITVRLFDINK